MNKIKTISDTFDACIVWSIRGSSGFDEYTLKDIQTPDGQQPVMSTIVASMLLTNVIWYINENDIQEPLVEKDQVEPILEKTMNDFLEIVRSKKR